MDDSDDPITATRSTYDEIAAAYRVRWADRSVVADQMARFVRHLRARDGGGRVLDVGCGPGFDAAALAEHGLAAIGLDLSWGMLREGRVRYAVPLLQGDLRSLPFGCCFDGLWVNASLLHLPRRAVPAALAEFRRVLRPAGLLFLSLKIGSGAAWVVHPFDSEAHPPRRRYFTYWTERQIAALLPAAGFSIVETTQNSGDGVTWLSLFAERNENE